MPGFKRAPLRSDQSAYADFSTGPRGGPALPKHLGLCEAYHNQRRGKRLSDKNDFHIQCVIYTIVQKVCIPRQILMT